MTLRMPALLLLLVLPVGGLLAQTSGSSTGRYATYTLSEDLQQNADGTSTMLAHYHQISFADDPSHPVDNTSSMCVGKFNIDSDGSMTAASGSCFSTDADGDGLTFWWRMTGGGTAECPDACGEWGYVAGDGKFSGIQGNGTWERTVLFSDGGAGTWEGSYTLP